MIPSPILNNAMESLEHCIDHFSLGSDRDRKFAILHLDQAVELILKEKVLKSGMSIYRKDRKTTLGLYETVELLKQKGLKIPEEPDLELIHEERNLLQHRSSSPDEPTTTYYVETGLNFVFRFLRQDLGMDPQQILPGRIFELYEDRDMLAKIDSLVQSARDTASSDPTGSVVSAVISAELILRHKYGKQVPLLETISLGEIVEALAKSGRLEKDQTEWLRNLWAARNAATHGQEIDFEQAKQFADLVKQLGQVLPRGIAQSRTT